MGVTNMGGMFFYASSFNGDLSKWDVSSVTNMKEMFAAASSFNGDVSKWDVSSVSDMSAMFGYASSFAQTLCGAWGTSKAKKDNTFAGSQGRIGTCSSSATKKDSAPTKAPVAVVDAAVKEIVFGAASIIWTTILYVF